METRAQSFRRWKRTLALIAVIWALGLGGILGWFHYQRSVHMRWYRKVEFLILQLTPKRPAEVTDAQWAQCLLHTWNLHTNFGPPGYFADGERYAFAAEFERRLQGDVGLATVDWIWDEYARNARARSYMHYRPTTSEMLEVADDLNKYQQPESLDSWIRRLHERELVPD